VLQPYQTIARILMVALLFVSNLQTRAQCVGAPDLVFANPVLISGTDGQVGATYRFPNIAPGLDAHITILALVNGAQLGEIDNTTQGYYDAWQPYVTAGANDTSYLDWLISFKKAGTNIDTTLPCLAVTAVDIDGDNNALKEFVRASTPGAYAIDPFTTLTVTFDGVHNQAIGQVTTIPLIDTNHREAMFQMNFPNVSSIIYRNGSISTKNTIDVRHTCIYFKPFFLEIVVILPVKLHSFNAAIVNQSTRLSWMVQEESAMHSYTVQRSLDGVNWSEIGKVYALNSQGHHSYYVYDHHRPAGISYYRLQLTDSKGQSTLSSVVQVDNSPAKTVSVKGATLVKTNLSLQVYSPNADVYSVRLYSMQGQLLAQKQFTIGAGSNQLNAELPLHQPDALYVLTITNKQGAVVYTGKLLRQR
jgi:hypothetical protein